MQRNEGVGGTVVIPWNLILAQQVLMNREMVLRIHCTKCVCCAGELFPASSCLVPDLDAH